MCLCVCECVCGGFYFFLPVLAHTPSSQSLHAGLYVIDAYCIESIFTRMASHATEIDGSLYGPYAVTLPPPLPLVTYHVSIRRRRRRASIRVLQMGASIFTLVVLCVILIRANQY